MVEIKAEDIARLPYPLLIEEIRKAFSGTFNIPQRHHHDYPNSGHEDSTLLLMPAWDEKYIGVKLVTISPQNGQYDLPSIQGSYSLYEVKKGTPVALLDAKALTTKRTAATSALASGFLSREDSKTLLMIGTGALAPELIRAHRSVRDYDKVLVWGRDAAKAKMVQDILGAELEIEVVKDLEEAQKIADVISVATLTVEPLVKGTLIKEGTHIDLVGAYRRDMRESDNDTLLRSSIFVDTREGATSESGELTIPLSEGTISFKDIQAELHDLCSGEHQGRRSENEITVFKSCGHAIEDLKAAELLYHQKIR